MKKDNRVIGIDILKVIGIVLVITVHFFLNTKFYTTPIHGLNMRAQSIIRNFCMLCVPLFMVITGYLNKEIKYDKFFFKKLINILIIWLFYSSIEFTVLHIMNHNIKGLNIGSFINELLSFKACGYSWYVEMYIGLFLLSPIINNAYLNFDDKNKKIALIISLILCIFPSFVNNTFAGTLHLPSWWIGFYPITYYIFGKYVFYFQPKIKKRVLFVLMLFSQLLLLFWSIKFKIETYHYLVIFIPTVITFLFFYNIDFKNKVLRRITTYIATISLDMFLASSLIDNIIYPWIYKTYNPIQTKIILFAPIILIITFTLSIIYASIRKFLIRVR